MKLMRQRLSLCLHLCTLSPVPETQRQVPLPYISSWVHAGKESEVWVANQGLFD